MKENTRQTIKIFFQHAMRLPWHFTAIVLSIVAASAIGAIIPLFYKQFFDALAQNEARGEIVARLVSLLFIIAVLNTLTWVCWRIATFTNAYFQSRMMSELSHTSFAYLHKHSFNFFNNSFVGSLVKKVKWFSRSFEAITDKFQWDFLPLLVSMVVIVAVLFWRNIWLGVAVCVWILIFLTINYSFTKYKLKYDIAKSKAETEVTAVLADTITNHAAVKLSVGYNREIAGFDGVNEILRRSRLFTWNLSNWFEALQGFLMVGLEIGAFYFAIQLWEDGSLTLGDFALIQSYFLILFFRLFNIGNIMRHVYEALADAEEMTEILMTPHEVKDIPTAIALTVTKGKIEFIDVDFAYNQTRKIFDRLQLTIYPKQSVALIGPSGAGKTTIVKLLLRQHDLTGGKILIDGQKIINVTQESLWSNISMVPQDPILFHRPLIENIRYGRPQATDEEVYEAAKKARCHEFIVQLSEGYQTHVGERGVKLSGGERQRVAIARAILADTPILVLDEATSSLDSESEILIQQALEELMKNKTVIIIAHRLSTIRKVDRIIAIADGRVIEDGTHLELIKKPDGVYNKLWNLQAGGFIP